MQQADLPSEVTCGDEEHVSTHLLQSIQSWGNALANAVYECELPEDFRRPKDDMYVHHNVLCLLGCCEELS